MVRGRVCAIDCCWGSLSPATHLSPYFLCLVLYPPPPHLSRPCNRTSYSCYHLLPVPCPSPQSCLAKYIDTVPGAFDAATAAVALLDSLPLRVDETEARKCHARFQHMVEVRGEMRGAESE